MYKICLSPQLVPELIEAGARVYIKKERKKKKVMITYKNTTQRCTRIQHRDPAWPESG